MSRQPCKCCEDKKPGNHTPSIGRSYNHLDGEAQEWAKSHRFSRSEQCVPVRGGKKFGGPHWQSNTCGDGSMGFSTRRNGHEEVNMEVGLDGQLKSKRHTLVNSKSSRAVASRRGRRIDGSKVGMISSVALLEAQRDPIALADISRAHSRLAKTCKMRGINHNKARRAAKRNRRVQLETTIHR